MKKYLILSAGCVSLFLSACAPKEANTTTEKNVAPEVQAEAEEVITSDSDIVDATLEIKGHHIADPLMPINRFFFFFNSRVICPLLVGYQKAIPLVVRKGIYNMSRNVAFPVCVVNSALQGKFKEAGREFPRFAINTTRGVLGWTDAAKKYHNMPSSKEDMGQTLASWGVKHGIYLHLPIIGPSSLRELPSLVADAALNPLTYIKGDTGIIVNSALTLNAGSLYIERLKDYLASTDTDKYEAIKQVYLAMRAGEAQDLHLKVDMPSPKKTEKISIEGLEDLDK